MKTYLEQFPVSETAERMLSRVSPIYDRSYVAKWLFQVMGEELDDAREHFDELRLQAFAETATWGMNYWEERYGLDTDERLDLETRRSQVIAKRDTRVPMNPTRVEWILGEMSARDFIVTENVAPYTFRVDMLDGANEVDYKKVQKVLYNIKPSHQNYLLNALMNNIEYCNQNAFYFIDLAVKFGMENLLKMDLQDLAVRSGFQTDTALSFKKLDMGSYFENKNYLILPDWAFHDSFFNFGRYISFNGEKCFDGDILFNQSITKGLPFVDFCVALTAQNQFSVSEIYDYTAEVINFNHFLPQIFAMKNGVNNTCNSQMPTFQITVNTNYKSSITATLEQDNLHYLDGSWNLDGSRLLNASKTEEEI